MLASTEHVVLVAVAVLQTVMIAAGLTILVWIKVKYNHLRMSMLDAIQQQFEPAVEVGVGELKVVRLAEVSQA